MRLLVDTDVLLDIALRREPHFDSSSHLITMASSGFGKFAIAWHTASNFYYLARKFGNDKLARGFLYDLSKFVEVAPVDAAHLRVAAKLPIPDLEDAMQVAAAISYGADLIVTRNVRDFGRSPIPAIRPAEAVERITDLT